MLKVSVNSVMSQDHLLIKRQAILFLEEHHVIPLAEGRSDSVENAGGLCPNCHRKCNFGEDIDSTRMELFDKVERITLVNYTN